MSEQGQSMMASVLQSTTLPAAGCGKSVGGRESSAATVGPGFVFQMTPDVAAINAFVRVVDRLLSSKEAGHSSVIGRVAERVKVSARPERVGGSRFVSDVLEMEEDE